MPKNWGSNRADGRTLFQIDSGLARRYGAIKVMRLLPGVQTMRGGLVWKVPMCSLGIMSDC